MNLLTATKETQGKRKNDFSFCDEGEIVTFCSECDGEAIDGACGCRRSMSGLNTHSATTTMKVLDVEITEQELINKIHKSRNKAGWGVDLAFATDEAKELIELGNAFPVGMIVEKRGNKVQSRI